jgi:phage gp36-like protein
MAYCNVGDIQARIGEATLRTLSDRDQTGEVDVARVAAAIADASAEVDAYAQARYPVPFGPVPAVIKQMTVKLAIYELYARGGYDPETQPAVAEDRKAAIDFLKRLASGQVTIGVLAPAKDAAAQVSAPPRIFSREKLEGF